MTEQHNAAVGFDALGLPENILSALSQLGFESATAIQAQPSPPLLAGRDVLGDLVCQHLLLSMCQFASLNY